MSENQNKKPMIFSDGMSIYRPHPKTVDFVYANLSINVNKFNNFLNKHVNEKGYVKVKVMISKKNPEELYGVFDDFVPKNPAVGDDGKTSKGFNGEDEINPEDIPF